MGWYLTSFSANHTKTLLASLAGALVCGAGNTLNDFLDIEADKLNHPNRPLPRGALPPYIAVLATAVLNIFAIVIGAVINIEVLGIIIFAIILLILYNFKFKKIPLAGNLSVSILGGATFIVGGLTEAGGLGPLPGAVIPAIFAILFHLGRELVKDLADLKGDLKARYKTLATVISYQNMMALISFVYIFLIMLTLIPMYYGWYKESFNYIVGFAVDIPLLIIILFLYLSENRSRFGRAGIILKLLMLLGLLAFYLGKF